MTDFDKPVRGMMYYRKALELQAFLDMAKDEGSSLKHYFDYFYAYRTCENIPESAFSSV